MDALAQSFEDSMFYRIESRRMNKDEWRIWSRYRRVSANRWNVFPYRATSLRRSNHARIILFDLVKLCDINDMARTSVFYDLMFKEPS